ncbi:degenerin unc-8-like [Glandiceps talaboti]
MEVETPKELPFPAVTICNKNPIRMSAIAKVEEYSDILQATNPSTAKYKIMGGECLGEDMTCDSLPKQMASIFGQTCYKSYMNCNKRADCYNFYDERHCYRIAGLQCDTDMFTCNNGNCIPDNSTCNHVDNCGDGSDETHIVCPQFADETCTDDQWKCDNGECIYYGFKCDGSFLDCGDMSDEMNCAEEPSTSKPDAATGEQRDCGSDEFLCGEECENNILLCDRMSDCPRGIDEMNCNYSDVEIFHDDWYEPYKSLVQGHVDDPVVYFDEFRKKIFKNRGFYFIPKAAEEPPVWGYFFIASRMADYSDLKDVLKLSKEQIAKFGHQLNDLVLDCSFGGESCNLTSEFTSFQDASYGNCYTFNNGKESDKGSLRKSSKQGPDNGLKLTLHLEQSEYTALYGQAAGIRVLIHSQNETAFPEDKGIGISPGTYTYMGLRKHVTEKKGYPYGECDTTTFLPMMMDEYKESTTYYSLLSCQKNCLQKKMLEYCGCILNNIRPEGLEHLPVCRVLNDTEVVCSQLIYHLFREGKLTCKVPCQVPCHEESFKKEISQYVWPSHIYEDTLLSTVYGQSMKTWGLTKENIRGNLLRVAIYYEELNYDRVYEKPAYELSQLWADIGGALGLWIGVSTVTVMEFLEFLVNGLLWAKRRLPRSDVSSNTS